MSCVCVSVSVSCVCVCVGSCLVFGSFALLSHTLVVDEEVEFNHQWLNSKVLAVEVFSTRFHWNNLHK